MTGKKAHFLSQHPRAFLYASEHLLGIYLSLNTLYIADCLSFLSHREHKLVERTLAVMFSHHLIK